MPGGGGRGGGGGGPPSNPDDWTCESCHNVNYARRSKCNRCQLPRPAHLGGGGGPGAGGFANAKPKFPAGVLSKEAVEKSAGLYKEGDWCCSKCGSV